VADSWVDRLSRACWKAYERPAALIRQHFVNVEQKYEKMLDIDIPLPLPPLIPRPAFHRHFALSNVCRRFSQFLCKIFSRSCPNLQIRDQKQFLSASRSSLCSRSFLSGLSSVFTVFLLPNRSNNHPIPCPNPFPFTLIY